MTFTNLHRLAAGAFMASGLLLGYSYISHPHHMTPEVIASTGWIIIHCLFLLSLIAGMLGTTGIYLWSARSTGLTGFIGFIAAFIGLVMISGLDYYEVFIAPFLAVEFPAVIDQHGAGDAMGPVAIAFPVSGTLTVLGYMLLAVANLRASTFSRPAMLMLFVTAVAFGVGLSPFGDILIARITALLFGLCLIWSGFDYWRAIATAETETGSHLELESSAALEA